MPSWRQLWGLDCPGSFGPTNWYVDLDQFAHDGFVIYFNIDGSCVRPLVEVAEPPGGAQIVAPGTPFYFTCDLCAGIVAPPNYGQLFVQCIGGGILNHPTDFYVDFSLAPSLNSMVLHQGQCHRAFDFTPRLPSGGVLVKGTQFFSNCDQCLGATIGWLRYVRCDGNQPPAEFLVPDEFYASAQDIVTCDGSVAEGKAIPPYIRVALSFGPGAVPSVACYEFAGLVPMIPSGGVQGSGSSCYFLDFDQQELNSCAECLAVQDLLPPGSAGGSPPGVRVIEGRVVVRPDLKKVAIKECPQQPQLCGDLVQAGCPSSLVAMVEMILAPGTHPLESCLFEHRDFALPVKLGAAIGMLPGTGPGTVIPAPSYYGQEGVHLFDTFYACFTCLLTCVNVPLALGFSSPGVGVGIGWSIRFFIDIRREFTPPPGLGPCDQGFGNGLGLPNLQAYYQNTSTDPTQLPILCPVGTYNFFASAVSGISVPAGCDQQQAVSTFWPGTVAVG